MDARRWFKKLHFVPVLSEIVPSFTFDLEKEEPKILNSKNNNCLACSKCLDNKVKNSSIGKNGKEFLIDKEVLHNVCRYYSSKVKYG